MNDVIQFICACVCMYISSVCTHVQEYVHVPVCRVSISCIHVRFLLFMIACLNSFVCTFLCDVRSHVRILRAWRWMLKYSILVYVPDCVRSSYLSIIYCKWELHTDMISLFEIIATAIAIFLSKGKKYKSKAKNIRQNNRQNAFNQSFSTAKKNRRKKIYCNGTGLPWQEYCCSYVHSFARSITDWKMRCSLLWVDTDFFFLFSLSFYRSFLLYSNWIYLLVLSDHLASCMFMFAHVCVCVFAYVLTYAYTFMCLWAS